MDLSVILPQFVPQCLEQRYEPFYTHPYLSVHLMLQTPQSCPTILLVCSIFPTSHFHLSLCAPVSLLLLYSSACWSSVSFHKPNSWKKYSRKQKSSSSRTYSYFGGSVGWNTPIRDHCLGVCVYILMSRINTFLVKYTLDIFRILITQTYGTWQNIVWWNISILILKLPLYVRAQKGTEPVFSCHLYHLVLQPIYWCIYLLVRQESFLLNWPQTPSVVNDNQDFLMDLQIHL